MGVEAGASVPRPFLPRDWFYLASRASVRWWARLYCGLDVRGRHHVPAHGGCLVVANHTSFLDPPLVGAVLDRRLSFMARATLFDHRLFGAWIRAYDAQPVARGKIDRRALQRSVELLRSGRALLLFPEGTRGSGDELLPFERGFLLIVRQARVPVLPVGLAGVARVLPRGAGLPRPRRIRVRIGAPLSWQEVDRLDASGVRDRVASLAHDAACD